MSNDKTAGPTTRAWHATQQIRRGAQGLLANARWRATGAALGAPPQVEGQRVEVEQARETVQSTVSEIEATEASIHQERKPALEELAAIDEKFDEVRAEIKKLGDQLQAKEADVAKLITAQTTLELGPLGSFQVPDAASLRKGAALVAEAAGLHQAIAEAKDDMQELLQAKVALGEELVLKPVEADPRMKDLYGRLKTHGDALSKADDKVIKSAIARFKAIFTDADKRRIAARLSAEISTGLPDHQEARLFYEGIVKAEKVLAEGIPDQMLAQARTRQRGVAGRDDALIRALGEKLNQQIDIEGLSEEQEALFFDRLIQVVMTATQPNTDVRSAITGMPAPSPGWQGGQPGRPAPGQWGRGGGPAGGRGAGSFNRPSGGRGRSR